MGPDKGHSAAYIAEEENKPWRQVDSNLGPLDYETVATTTLPPTLPHIYQLKSN